jgi:hypothetical protein
VRSVLELRAISARHGFGRVGGSTDLWRRFAGKVQPLTPGAQVIRQMHNELGQWQTRRLRGLAIDEHFTRGQ